MHYLLDRVHNELLLTKMACNGKNTIVTGIFGGILESQVCWLPKINPLICIAPYLSILLCLMPDDFKTETVVILYTS